jgi:GT2 family glycosyltransferase
MDSGVPWLLWSARLVYRYTPLPDPFKRRIRLLLKTRLGLLFGRRRTPSYGEWVRRYDTPTEANLLVLREEVERLIPKPRFVLFVESGWPVRAGFERLVEAMRQQTYCDWELFLISRDRPVAESVRDAISALQDPRFRVLTGDHLADLVNEALATVEADFVAFLDSPGVPATHSLHLMAARLAHSPRAVIVYGDEDRLDPDGLRLDPWFKPDWDPDLILSQFYFGAWTWFRLSAVRAVGGLRREAHGVLAHDLALRLLASTPPPAVLHLPFVLFHAQEPTAPEDPSGVASRAAQAVMVDEHLRAVGKAVESVHPTPAGVHVRYRLANPHPLVSVVVPTRDHAELLERCLDGVLHRTSYRPLEVIIVDNGSREPRTLKFLSALSADPRIRVLRHDMPFNYSALVNLGVCESRGKVVALLNDDIEVVDPEWLRELVGHACRPEIGVVGARLLYPDGTIQHAGIALGVGLGCAHIHRRAAVDRERHGALSLARSCAAVTFACAATRREVFDRVGGLDEALGVAFNDVDFCLRAWQLGWRNLYTPFATLLHVESATRGYDDDPKRLAVFKMELDSMKARWGDRFRTDPYYSPNLTAEDESMGPAFPPRVGPAWRDPAGLGGTRL